MQNRLLGIHMIVQNEEHDLPRCLDSLKPFGSECFITDTGSTDGTPEIARQNGATVLHARWENSFAQARNISLPLANTEWILCLDADEYVTEGLEDLLNYLPKVHKRISRLRITIENRVGEETGEGVVSHPVRLFRAHQGYQYMGRIHEQLVRSHTRENGEKKAADHGIEESFSDEKGLFAEQEPLAPLQLVHDGYLASIIAQRHKPLRNLELLKRELADHPGQPFHLYNMGVTYCQLGRYEQAYEAFSQSLHHTPLQAPYRPTLIRDYAKILVVLQRYDEAHGLLAIERQRYESYADLHLLYGETLEQQGLEEQAYKSYARAADCRMSFSRDELLDASKVKFQEIHSKVFEHEYKQQSEKSCAGEVPNNADEAIWRNRSYVTDLGSEHYKAYTSMAKLAQKRGFLQESVHLYGLALDSEMTYAPALAGLADVLQQLGETDESIVGTLRARWKGSSGKQGSDHSIETCEHDLTHVVHALASSGAYGQALQLVKNAQNMRVSNGDYLQWMLCANRVSDALQYVQNQWSEERIADLNLQLQHRMDLALTYWINGLPVSDSVVAAADPQEREGWGMLNGLLNMEVHEKENMEAGGDKKTVHQVPPAATKLGKEILKRAVHTGQLAFARRLYEKMAEIGSEHSEGGIQGRWLAAVLYRQGYTMAAADMLIQSMSQGDLDAQSHFYLGEALYAKEHYDQALILFQQALERNSELCEARAGAAVCYLRLALGAIRQELNRTPSAKVLMAQQVVLEQQLRIAEGIPWRTVFHARERRNQLADQTHFIMHDREG